MIVHPANWKRVGQEVTAEDIGEALRDVLSDIQCEDLSFSGGLDSSLLLSYMLELGRKVRTFTMALTRDHPDVIYSYNAISYFQHKYMVKIERTLFILEDVEAGDTAVAAYYERLASLTDSIITGDGVDEFMAGYYAHQGDMTEENYYRQLRDLQSHHLEPLNKNSGKVAVHIPYIDPRMINLMSQIPLSEKVDGVDRKKVLVELARDRIPEEIIDRRKYGLATRAKSLAV